LVKKTLYLLLKVTKMLGVAVNRKKNIMPRIARQDGTWDFKVEPQQLNMPDGSKSGVFANVRTDTGKVVGVISPKGYGIIQNADFIGTIRNALQGLGLDDFKETVMATNNGSRIYATYTFDNRVKQLAKVGDKVGLRLRFTNSFDGKLAARGELMGIVLRCLNGMVMEDAEFALQQRHTPKISLEFVQKVIAQSVSSFDASIALFDAMANREVTDEQGIAILSHAPLSEKVRKGIEEIWITPSFIQSRERNLYALYDAVTEYLRDIEAERFEYAAKTNRQALRHLTRALDSATFAQLVVPCVDVVEVPAQEVQ
jgi:hypothetical protein